MNHLRALDADIARLIFKYVIVVDTEKDNYYVVDAASKKQKPVSLYSTKLDNAYEIVSRLQNHGFLFEIRNSISPEGDLSWIAGFHKHNEPINNWYTAKTLPETICAAALGLLSGIPQKKS